MMLKSTQSDMKNALMMDNTSKELSVQLSDERRLFIYKNTIFGQLLDVLSSTYSGVKGLVGEDYFNMLGHTYIGEHMPSEASLTYYGEEFADYLAQQEALEAMPYVIEMAHFEWAWNHSFFASDKAAFDPSSLMELDETTLEQVVFSLHPSVQLITTDYPIHELWQWIEGGAPEPAPEIKKYPVTLLLWRTNEHEIAVEALSKKDAEPWEKLISGQPLYKVLENVPSEKQGEWLEKILISSMVTDHSMESETSND